MSTKAKLKELIFECESEEEAMHLLQSYRKKNFHLVSKKVVNPADSTIALKLIKFRQATNEENLETVWENFVTYMSKMNIDNGFTAEILNRIRDKKNFWEVHPHDHLRDIVMDARNFVKPEYLAKVLVVVAPTDQLMDFFCAYQKALSSIISSLGIFTLVPKELKANMSELKISNQVQLMSFDETHQLDDFSQDIEHKVGIVLVPEENMDFICSNVLDENINNHSVSLICSTQLDQKILNQLPEIKYLAGSYSDLDFGVDVFKSLDISLKNQLPLAFIWNESNLGSILNPEAQVLKILDDLLENQSSQQLGN